MPAAVLAFQNAAPRVKTAPPAYDAAAVREAKNDIMRAIVLIEEHAALSRNLRELACCEQSLNQCAAFAVAASEFVHDLTGAPSGDLLP